VADGDPGRGVEPADGPIEAETLEVVSIEPIVKNGEMDACVCLGGTRWRTNDADSPGRGTDASNGQTDTLRGETDALGTSNNAGTAGMSDGEGAETYLGVRHATDGIGSQSDTSIGHSDVPSVETHTNRPTNTPEIVSIPRKREKPPDSPVEAAKWTPDVPDGCRSHADASRVCTDAQSIAHEMVMAENEARNVSIPQNDSNTESSPMETAKWHPDEPNGCGSHADGSSAHTHAYCIGNNTQTAANEAESVRTRRMGSKMQNSPVVHGIVTAKRPRRWRMVSVEEVHMYVPWNASIETASQNFVFGRVESRDEAIVPNVEGERAGNGDGNGDGDNGDVGDMDGTTSSGDSDSIRVEAALLAGESQRVRYS